MRCLVLIALACAVAIGPPLPMSAHPVDAEVIPLTHAKASDFALIALAMAEPRPLGPPSGYCALMLPGHIWPARHDPVLHVVSDARTNSIIVWGDLEAKADVRVLVERFEDKHRWPRERAWTSDD